MANQSRKLRASMKAVFEPAMEEAGFAVDYPEFRRDNGDSVDVVDVQPWKEGGAFIINAARFAEPDKLAIPRDRLCCGMPGYLRQERFGPAGARRSDDPYGWYHYAHIADDKPALNALAEEAASMIPQIDAWLKDGTRGPNIDPENP